MALLVDRWRTHPGHAALRDDVIDVWAVDLAQDPSTSDQLGATLSPDERERSARFHFERDRLRFVHARRVLRILLGEYLDVSPETISFAYGARGKPRLGGDTAGALSFNVSHSNELALITVAPARIDVGVDVELIRPMRDAAQIAGRFFAAAEVARWRSLPAGMQEAGFFQCWTCKEAYVKAVGDGLARPLQGFEVEFGAGQPVHVHVIGDERESRRWVLTGLTPPPDYAAAVVATDGFGVIECWRWSPRRRDG